LLDSLLQEIEQQVTTSETSVLVPGIGCVGVRHTHEKRHAIGSLGN